jgi:hypothetical protein
MPAPAEPTSSWPRSRWLIAITVVCGIQFAMIVLLTLRSPVVSKVEPNTVVTIPGNLSSEIQALTDPTLLALGGTRGFSRIWMDLPELEPVDPTWEQTPDWLAINPQGLGSNFQAFAASTGEPSRGLAFKPEPETLPSAPPRTGPSWPPASRLSITGGLNTRRLLHRPELPSWPAEDLLVPTRVRVVVDARGMVMSTTLQSGSGSTSADQFALKTSRQLRFAPSRSANRERSLAFGELVFQWHTTQEAPDEN